MKIAIVSVFLPYRGGIAQFNEAMAKAFTAAGTNALANFSRQYPSLIFPGTNQYEDGLQFQFVRTEAIDSVNPMTWYRCARLIVKEQPDVVIVPFWTAFWRQAATVVRRVKALHPSARIVGLFHNANSHDAKPWERRLRSDWSVASMKRGRCPKMYPSS